MNLTLIRHQIRADGIFGELFDSSGGSLAVSLEHAYLNSGGSFYAKIPSGPYVCQRGMHQLEGMISPFVTFEVTEVPGHTNILFHWGNYNRDSQGCILLGDQIAQGDGGQMITQSRATFARFMILLSQIESFQLIVKGGDLQTPKNPLTMSS